MLVAVGVLGLAIFYMVLGPLDFGEDEKRGGRLIERFAPMDRYAHWLLAITWVTMAITGLILSLGKSVLLPLIGYTLFSWLAVLVFPNFDQTRSTMQLANVVHMVAAYIAISLALVHIYLGTIGMVDAYKAMRYGYVDESWAKHHHTRWYEDVAAGRARQHFVD